MGAFQSTGSGAVYFGEVASHHATHVPFARCMRSMRRSTFLRTRCILYTSKSHSSA
jgi:hypothetical protein